MTKAEIGTGETGATQCFCSSLRTEGLQNQIDRPDKLGSASSVSTLGGLGPEGYEKSRVYAGGSGSLSTVLSTVLGT